MDGHGHGWNGLERSGTIWNGPKRSGTKWKSWSRHGTVTFSVKNERFTVSLLTEFLAQLVIYFGTIITDKVVQVESYYLFFETLTLAYIFSCLKFIFHLNLIYNKKFFFNWTDNFLRHVLDQNSKISIRFDLHSFFYT